MTMKTARKIDGKLVAEQILLDLKQKIAVLPKPPGLAVILIGNDPASTLYVNNKEKACLRVGMAFHKYLCNDQRMTDANQHEVLAAIADLNRDPTVHGIIVQLPVPQDFNADQLVSTVDPKKDVDGFHPDNVKRFLGGDAILTPPVIGATLRLLAAAGVSLVGATVALVTKNGLLRKMLYKILADAGARVTVATADDAALTATTRAADVVISAIGKPGLITGDRLKPDAVVIDIGITRQGNGHYVGDVDAASVEKIATAYTPTPGGVGPLTVALLLQNVYQLAQRSTKLTRKTQDRGDRSDHGDDSHHDSNG